MRARRRTAPPVRWAVAGLGHIAQVAVLPAFAHARRNSHLVALVSDDPHKLRAMRKRHDVPDGDDYDHLEDLLERAEVDALYVALPNHLHAAFTLRALRAGVHVLCEKPMAVDSVECERMIDAAQRHDRRLMIAYRLHFERGNLEAIRLAANGRLGDVTDIHGTLTLTVRDRDNIRLGPRGKGGGPMYDLGIYCLNAARYLFRAEPEEVMAWTGHERTRGGAEERIVGVVRFPGARHLMFNASLASSPVSELRLFGTKGDLRVVNAFDYAEGIRHELTKDDETRRRTFQKRDQFAPELLYFADCVQKGREPEPSGREGLADVRVIEALYRAASSGRPQLLPPFAKRRRPDLRQEMRRPAVAREPEQVHATGPSKSPGD